MNPEFVVKVLEIMTYTFVFIVGLLVLAAVVIFIIDVTQTKQAIRRNYPVIGRLRYLFEEMGKFSICIS